MSKFQKPVITRALMIVGAVLLAISLFVPLWRIDFEAPQYPEGLLMYLWPNKISGDVEIINGLNHYIGMKTLHTEDFIEFKVLPYLIGFFSILFLITGLLRNRKLLVATLVLFLIFGIVSMVDFYMWEYDYGHDLDPKAAIVVPGMAYQPPLIGYKQLLNFGVYSLPDIGGWLFIVSGLLVLTAVILEFFYKKNKTMKIGTQAVSALAILTMSAMMSCGNINPEPISINKDACHECKMGISDLRYASQLKTDKGRAYKFDDIICLISFIKKNNERKHHIYFRNFNNETEDIPLAQAHFVQSPSIKGPMNGNVAVVNDKQMAMVLQSKTQGTIVQWADIIQSQ